MAGSVKDKTIDELKNFSETSKTTAGSEPMSNEVVANLTAEGAIDDDKLLVFYDEQILEELQITQEELSELTQEIHIEAYYVLANDPKKYSCQFENFLEQDLCVLTYHDNVVVGDTIEINLSFDYGKNSAKIKISGCVRESHLADTSQYINIDIPKESVDFFDSFLNLNRMRQKNVTAFLKLAKGA